VYAHCSILGAVSTIAVFLLQILPFNRERPPTIELVDDRAPLESGKFLHALVIEGRYPSWVLLILFKRAKGKLYTLSSVDCA
jgi:hypothetical protein